VEIQNADREPYAGPVGSHHDPPISAPPAERTVGNEAAEDYVASRCEARKGADRNVRTCRCRGVDLHVRQCSGNMRTVKLFRRRNAVHFDTGHAGDDQLLAQLSQMSDLTAPRHWVHYLYFADEAAARGAAAVVAAAGWELQNVAESAAGGPEWVVIAERHGAVTSPEAVREARRFFDGIARQWAGGDYDGWEASA